MFVIGERINGMFTETRRAIEKRDKAAIQDPWPSGSSAPEPTRWT